MSGLEVTMMKRIGELNEEVKRLKAEVGELCEAIKLASEVGIKMADEVTRLKAEVDALKLGSLLTAVDVLQFINLKAEVERLRKAGDAMQKRLYVLENPTHPEVYLKLLSAWNAAKEGKQP